MTNRNRTQEPCQVQKVFDVVVRMNQDEFADGFLGEGVWPERCEDEVAMREASDFDPVREFAYDVTNRWSAERMLVIVS